MATAMLNVRLDKNLKAEGERVLGRQGISATDAVRGLYRYLEQNDKVPDFCKPETGAITADARRQKMRQLIGVAQMCPGEDLDALKRERLSRMDPSVA